MKMIYVSRASCPSVLAHGASPISEGEIETLDAILFFSDIANHQEKYRRMGRGNVRIKEGYRVYSDKTVRQVLEKMFHGKCAYCESKVTTTYNGDIEHFRPKAAHCNSSGEPLVRPGYYWLAAEWDNLLFSCAFCNQTNTHKIDNGGVIEEVVLGKLNQFPLVSERYRLQCADGSNYFTNRIEYESSLTKEEGDRLLLNPCKDGKIETYFEYDDEGAIMERQGLDSTDSLKAKTSIRVYALHRMGLTLARQERVILIQAQIKRVETAIRNYNKYVNASYEEKIWFEGIMKEEMKILKKFKNPDQEYSALAKYIIDKYFDEAKFV